MNDYNSLARYLKRHCLPPDGCKVSIHRIRMSSRVHGSCVYWNKKFHVKINNTLSEVSAIDTLLHEYAHCLSWDSETLDHNYTWGVAYSKVYKHYLNWLKEE